MKKILIFIPLLLLQACSNLEFPGVYSIPIEQGNVVTQEMVDQLKPGMSKEQVTFVLGTPLIQDAFNGQRWDYLYSVQRGDKPREQHRISVFFDQSDRLSYFSGDFQPSPAEPQEIPAPSVEENAEAAVESTSEGQPATQAPSAASRVSNAEDTNQNYWVQYYAGRSQSKARFDQAEEAFGEKTVVVTEEGLNKYLVGPHADLQQALAARKALVNMGFEDAFVRKPGL